MLSFLCRYCLQTSSHTGTALKFDLFHVGIKLGCGHLVMDQQLSCITVYRSIDIKIHIKKLCIDIKILDRSSAYFLLECITDRTYKLCISSQIEHG